MILPVETEYKCSDHTWQSMAMQTTSLLSVFQRRQVVSDRLFLPDSFHPFYAYFVNAYPLLF
ncbi:hypothetical protein [Fischerella thermalis]|uniref:hypothetical protein n=1 Tax=Fischerella thermalis TaxID=372787 RepID=UPI0011AFA1C1|nr:hypothetical protein [Fischerella thermalis]